MPDTIGPTFTAELIAAGLDGLPFSWGSDGSISGRENLTQAQNDALDVVLAAHDPAAELDYSEIDLATLNSILAQQGSIVRALGLIMFEEINKLRVNNGDQPYTLAQFKTALVTKMRN